VFNEILNYFQNGMSFNHTPHTGRDFKLKMKEKLKSCWFSFWSYFFAVSHINCKA